MFKSTFSLFSWTSSTKQKDTPDAKSSGPSAFTIGGKGTQLLRVLMNDSNDQEGFVDISTRKLSYAEVALMAPSPKKKALATPAPGRTIENKFEVLNNNKDLEIDTDYQDPEYPEKFKSDFHGKSNKKKAKKVRRGSK